MAADTSLRDAQRSENLSSAHDTERCRLVVSGIFGPPISMLTHLSQRQTYREYSRQSERSAISLMVSYYALAHVSISFADSISPKQPFAHLVRWVHVPQTGS